MNPPLIWVKERVFLLNRAIVQIVPFFKSCHCSNCAIDQLISHFLDALILKTSKELQMLLNGWILFPQKLTRWVQLIYSFVADILSTFIFIFMNSSVADILSTSRKISSQHEADFPLGFVPQMNLLEWTICISLKLFTSLKLCISLKLLLSGHVIVDRRKQFSNSVLQYSKSVKQKDN